MRRFPKDPRRYIPFWENQETKHTPRLSKSLPKYRKHKSSGQAIVNVRGRDHCVGPHGTAVSRRECDRLVGEYPSRDRQPESLTVDETAVNKALAAFWRHAKGGPGGDCRCGWPF
ncbi:hypothetical protein CA51_49410 [Rosistilla oblonga]|nr:hypothetical protein CA51_49410 [Rosistilla oblonga]